MNGNTFWGDGSIWGGKEDRNGTVICNAIGSQRNPRICYDGAGGAIITWYDNRDVAVTCVDIYAQKINSRGDTLWKSNGTVISNAEDEQSSPMICNDGTGGAIIMWSDNRDAAVTGVDIYAQKIKLSPGEIYALADDDDDDDDEEELNILLIVLIIILISVGALTIIIVVSIKKRSN